MGSIGISVSFVDMRFCIDVPTSINIPTIFREEPLDPIQLTSNPVGNGTLTFVPSHTNGAVTTGKIVAADS